MREIEALFGSLRPISLDAMNERAALQRRTDNKYVVGVERLASLVRDLSDEHEVLEIDGDRVVEYESTYFDTPSFRCFRDHVADRRPRYKTRTRCYVTTGKCFFEVKVKRTDGETSKEHVDYDADERGTIAPAARELIREVLGELGLGDPHDLEPSLVTAFERVTVVALGRPERTTFDFGITLRAPGGDRVQLEGDSVVVETKTEEGDGAWDRALAAAGCEPVSLSKYRVGTGMLRAAPEDEEYARDVKRLFKAPR